MTTQKAPLVIAHRGASGSAPENTMAAFQRAVAAKADMIELDVQRTKDGQVVVIHDHTLKRTTNGTGEVRQYTLEELRQFDAGSWYGAEFAGERIPTLAEVLRAIKGKCGINIEIKNLPYRDPGVESAVLAVLRETEFPLDQVIISSFDHRCLVRVAELEPNVRVAALFAHNPASLAGIDTPVLHPYYPVVDAEFMSWAKGRMVNVWTVDAPEKWQALIALGVDGIITNHPDRLVAYLKEQGLRRG